MDKKILHASNIAAEALLYIIYMMAELTLMLYFGDGSPYIIWSAALFAVPLFFYFVRVRIHRLFFFSLCHVMPPILVFFLFSGDMAGQAVFTIAAVIQCLYSIGVRSTVYFHPERRHYGTSSPPVPVALGFAIAFFAISGHNGIAVFAIAFIGLFFVHRYLVQFLDYTELSRLATGNVRSKELFGLDFSLVGGFTLLSVLAMAAVAGREFFSGASAFFADLLRRFLRWLIGIFEFSSQEASETYTAIEENMVMPPMESEETALSRFFDFIDRLLAIAVNVVIAAAAVFLVYVFIRFIINMMKSRAKGQEVASGLEDVVEKISRTKEKKGAAKRRFFASPDEKIRHVFVAAALANKGEGSPYMGGLSAREWMLLPRNKDNEEASPADSAARHAENEARLNLAGLYEKARYAPGAVSAADARLAKRYAKVLAQKK